MLPLNAQEEIVEEEELELRRKRQSSRRMMRTIALYILNIYLEGNDEDAEEAEVEG